MDEIAQLLSELDRLHHRQAELRSYERRLAECGENDPASDTWKMAAIVAASAEADFQAVLIRNYSTISRVLRDAAAEGWRPIETAPSTGDHVLVFGGRHVEPEYVRSDGDWWRMRVREGSTQQPTHWRPLPPPPSEAATLSQETRNDD